MLFYEEVSAATAEVEAILSSYPLSPLSSDPNDLSGLTPGHFLVVMHYERYLILHGQTLRWRLWSVGYKKLRKAEYTYFMWSEMLLFCVAIFWTI